jgi:hypothetical protein
MCCVGQLRVLLLTEVAILHINKVSVDGASVFGCRMMQTKTSPKEGIMVGSLT